MAERWQRVLASSNMKEPCSHLSRRKIWGYQWRSSKGRCPFAKAAELGSFVFTREHDGKGTINSFIRQRVEDIRVIFQYQSQQHAPLGLMISCCRLIKTMYLMINSRHSARREGIIWIPYKIKLYKIGREYILQFLINQILENVDRRHF